MYSTLLVKELPRVDKWCVTADVWPYVSIFFWVSIAIPAIYEIGFHYLMGIPTSALKKYLKDLKEGR